MLTSAQGSAQQRQEFDVAGRPLLFNGGGTGTGTTVGSYRDYANVITINGTQIDARVTLTALSGATVQTFDSTTNPYAETNHLQPNLNISAAGGHATFRVDFFANGQPVTLRNFYVNTYDLDGSGGSASARQYTDFTGFASYTLSTASKVAMQSIPGGTRFVTTVGGNLTYTPGTDDFNTIRARVFYLNASSLTVSVGDTSGTGVAYFGLDFSIGYAFNNMAGDTVAPVVTAGQSFAYQENRGAGSVVATVAATDQYGVVRFRFAATNTQTSGDGYYAIDNVGAIRLTAAGAAAGAPTNDFETQPNSFTYAVQAADEAGNWSAAENVTINVTDVDEPVITGPGGVPGASSSVVSVDENQTAATSFSANKPVTWSITGGADAARFAIDATTGVVTFRAAPDFETPSDSDANNSYLLVVTADDGTGSVVSQTVAVTVLDVADAPLGFTGTNATSNGAPSYLFTNPENRAAGAVLGTVTAGGGTGPYSYGIVGGNADGWYAIDAATGAISLTTAGAASLANDFEQTPNTQALSVRAQDAANATAIVVVTLNETDLDDVGPVITGPGGVAGAVSSAVSVNENQTGATSLTADEAATWSIVGGADAARFSIDASTGVVTFFAAPDYEAPTDGDRDNRYVLLVQAQDAAGNASTQAVTVTVLDLDETAPVVSGPAGGAVSVPEGTAAVTTLTANEGVSWSIAGGVDAARFAVSSSGAVTFVTAPDFEAPADANRDNVYLVTVTATDAAGNISLQPLTVTVTDASDAPPVITGPSGGPGATGSALSLNEGVTAVTTLTADEPTMWSIAGGSDAARFAIDPSTGAVSFLTAPDFEVPTDSDGDNRYVLIVRATDAEGLSSTHALTVAILNVDDAPPVITGPSGGPGAIASAKSVNENIAAVATLAANEAVSWAITGGVDAGRFAIDPASGALSFTTAPDYEAPDDTDRDDVYQLTVTAIDGAGNASMQAVTVTVLDVDDAAPVIGVGAAAVSVDEGRTAVVTLTADKPVTWNVTDGPDANRFTISSAGALSFVTAPDHEAPTDADGDNVYQLVVTATDANGATSMRTISVTVVDLDDTAPVIAGHGGGPGASGSAVLVDEGETAAMTLSANEAVTWAIIGGSDAARFLIDPATGAITFQSAPDYETPADADRDNVYSTLR